MNKSDIVGIALMKDEYELVLEALSYYSGTSDSSLEDARQNSAEVLVGTLEDMLITFEDAEAEGDTDEQ